MRRGAVCIANLEPAQGSESNKVRPVAVVSATEGNEVSVALHRGVVTVVPLTSNVTRVYPFQVFVSAEVSGLRADSKAQVEQIRAIDVARITTVIGELPTDVMTKIDEALRIHLAL